MPIVIPASRCVNRFGSRPRNRVDGPGTQARSTRHPSAILSGMALSDERNDLLSALEKHRGFLRQTLAGITDEEAARRTTVSELCLGGIVKHVTQVERGWVGFIQRGPEAMGGGYDEAAIQAHADGFRMLDGDTVSGLLEQYANASAQTAQIVEGLPSLDVAHPLPEAPWFERADWTARRVLLHILAETAQHAGHADIIREAIDGAKTMG